MSSGVELRATMRSESAKTAGQLLVAAQFAFVLLGYQTMNTRYCIGLCHEGSASRSRLVGLHQWHGRRQGYEPRGGREAHRVEPRWYVADGVCPGVAVRHGSLCLALVVCGGGKRGRAEWSHHASESLGLGCRRRAVST